MSGAFGVNKSRGDSFDLYAQGVRDEMRSQESIEVSTGDQATEIKPPKVYIDANGVERFLSAQGLGRGESMDEYPTRATSPGGTSLEPIYVSRRRTDFVKELADSGGEAERFGNKNPPSDVLVELRGMFIAEKEQRKYDRFWGLDKEQADQIGELYEMAAEDAVSSQYQRAAQLRAQYEDWERVDVARRQKHAQLRAQEEEENRKAYMKMFHESTSSNDVMEYHWPTKPSLAHLFDGSEVDMAWWPLDKPLQPDPRSTFHSSKGQRQQTVTQMKVDEFVRAVNTTRHGQAAPGASGFSSMASTHSSAHTPGYGGVGVGMG
eukprot:CAMPEP_0119466238 /NCGR_PEP_ID=MMETSP1344-20130328/988_1 /TAXON_ID=236787 /ORGANISM="Florenciella parvula, Strain CCMP2471" /LENGTH=319 /DNA_ID=CAMNT_0007498541 /DNA_START=361 /DNA_END=1317 /DNA_ORIENTATION=-